MGTVEVLHMGAEKCLVTCDGMYKTPLFTKPIEAKSLLFVQSSFSRDEEGVVHVTHQADLFVSFPSQAVDVFSRIFSPLTVSMTDRTFTEISLFLKMISTAMTRRPDWVEQIADKMDGVPDIRKTQVLELNAQVHSSAQKRALKQAAPVEAIHTGQVPTGSTGTAPRRDPADKAMRLAPAGFRPIARRIVDRFGFLSDSKRGMRFAGRRFGLFAPRGGLLSLHEGIPGTVAVIERLPAPSPARSLNMPAFTPHIFVCCNHREPGSARGCCDPDESEALRNAFKAALKKRNLGPCVRANKAGCLDQCELGPTVVIYPHGIWYGGVKISDVPRIIEETVVHGRILEDLLIPDEKLNCGNN